MCFNLYLNFRYTILDNDSIMKNYYIANKSYQLYMQHKMIIMGSKWR